MKKFKHLKADTLDRAVLVLREYKSKAKVIAGGTDLLGEMQDAILPEYPEVIINLKNIPGMEYIKEENGQLHIGALTKLEDIATNDLIKKKYPVLMEASCKTASPHIREMGTIGGNICQSNRCWYYWVADNRFNCLRKGGATCYAVNGDARYHSIFGSTRVYRTPCSVACPDNIDISDYMDRIREGDITGAARIVLEANPLASITGRVCPHFCEYKCNRVDYDESVSIKSIERYIGDYILDNPNVVDKPAQRIAGKKVAVVGSGPAGLTSAFYLNRLGYSVTVFEKMPKAGGLLRYGIPTYRLPKNVVDKQIKLFERASIKFNTGAKIKVSELSKSYDAVFLACGAGKERNSGIVGDELLISGMEYLRKINSGEREAPGKKIAVIGGGNAAIDVARTLLRLGAEPIVLYRRGREEMPALNEEVEKAEEEGIKIQFLTVPVEASKQTGGVTLKCIKNRLGEPDESGRPRPEPIPGSEYTVTFDAVMAALGEEPDTSIVPKSYLDAKGRLKAGEDLNLGDNIFAGGDFISGPSTVVQAIASGRKAASNIDTFLGGKKKRESKNTGWKAPDRFNGAMLGQTRSAHAPELVVTKRITNLDAEDTGGLPLANVEQEANRCFNCGCVATNPSDLAPALIALGAEIKTTRRVIPAEKFFTVDGDKTTVLTDDEIVKEIVVPAVEADTRCKFIKFALRRSIDFPLVNCAAAIASDKGMVRSARICLNSVYTQPYRVTKAEEFLKGKSLDVSTAEAAADLITGDTVSLLNNKYKIQIARTLVKRVILACVNTKRNK